MVRKAAKKDGGTKVLLNVSDFAPGEYSVSLKLIIPDVQGKGQLSCMSTKHRGHI